MDAVGCAITLQSVLYLLHDDAPEGQGIRLRMGLSVGEVLLVDNDIHGTGVNIAARLEGLARPGEICLCERAVNDVRHMLPLVFEPIGARRLRNISTPIPTFRVTVEMVAAVARQGMLPAADHLPARPALAPRAAPDTLGDRRRHLVRHPVHAVRRADRVHAAGAHAQPRRHGSSRSRTRAAAAGGGVALSAPRWTPTRRE